MERGDIDGGRGESLMGLVKSHCEDNGLLSRTAMVGFYSEE